MSFFLHWHNFWRIKFTPKKRVNYGKIHSKLPIFRVKSVKNYTGQKKFTREFSWHSWQIWGMLKPRGRCAFGNVLFVSMCLLYIWQLKLTLISIQRHPPWINKSCKYWSLGSSSFVSPPCCWSNSGYFLYNRLTKKVIEIWSKWYF